MKTFAKLKEMVGKNVKAYREAAGLSTSVLAMKAYIPQEKLEDIEAGREIVNEWWYLLRLSETLGLAYYDFFETEEGETSKRNIPIPSNVTGKIVQAAHERGYTVEKLAKALGTHPSTAYYWQSGKMYPSPFNFTNLLGLANLTSDSFMAEFIKTEKEAEQPKDDNWATVLAAEPPKVVPKVVQAHELGWIDEREREKPVGLGEVIKACQVYQKLDSVISQLDAIIKTATDLKAELEKERA